MSYSQSIERFEDEISRDLEPRGPYLVYADWLLQRGDPRGELIAVQDALEWTTDAARRAELQAREQAILDAHLTTWMGGEVRGPRIKLGWRRGFLDQLVLDYREADVSGLSRLLQSPMCRFVRTMKLGTDVAAGLLELRRSPYLRRLQTLNLGSYRWSSYSIRGLAAAVPGLLHLDCDASLVELADLTFPALRSLGLATSTSTLDNIDALASARLPALASLLIWGGGLIRPALDDDDDVEIPTFAAPRWAGLLEAGGVPALRALHFDACSFGDELVDAIADSQLLRQLSHVTLDDHELTGSGYARLLGRADAFRHLARLKLRDAAAAASIKARLTQALGPIVVW
ncbi:MAG: TIGR02996 domain-containing protein [Kofleriaceae bacterium]